MRYRLITEEINGVSMTQQSSFFKQIYSLPKPQVTGMGSIGIGVSDPNAGRVVVDSWNKKYYGEDSKNSYLHHYDSQIQSIRETLARGYTETRSNNNFMGWGLNQTQRVKLDDTARLNLTTQIDDIAQQRQDFDQNYVQSKDFFASYDAYQGDWNKFFEASYRNPRIEVEQKSDALNKNEQFKAQVDEANNKAQLVSANQLEVQAPRQVGTGVGASRDTQINQLVNNGGIGLGL